MGPDAIMVYPCRHLSLAAGISASASRGDPAALVATTSG